MVLPPGPVVEPAATGGEDGGGDDDYNYDRKYNKSRQPTFLYWRNRTREGGFFFVCIIVLLRKISTYHCRLLDK